MFVLLDVSTQELGDGGRDAALHVLPVLEAVAGRFHLCAGDCCRLQGVRKLHPKAVQALAGEMVKTH